jgi:cytoskeletal protein CcmA (bactofilin family)
MREERGHLRGNLVIDEPYTLWGSIAGDVTAVKGSKFYVRGPIYGSLTVLHGGRVHVFGNITGNLTIKDGAKVIHSGVVGGDVINQGGRLYVDRIARTLGDIRTEDDGKTTIESENPDRPEVD